MNMNKKFLIILAVVTPMLVQAVDFSRFQTNSHVTIQSPSVCLGNATVTGQDAKNIRVTSRGESFTIAKNDIWEIRLVGEKRQPSIQIVNMPAQSVISKPAPVAQAVKAPVQVDSTPKATTTEAVAEATAQPETRADVEARVPRSVLNMLQGDPSRISGMSEYTEYEIQQYHIPLNLLCR